jgi:hypothetical protein
MEAFTIVLSVTQLFYVLAIDHDKREPRMFRMDRVRKERVARDVTFVPDQEIVEALRSPEAYEEWRAQRPKMH